MSRRFLAALAITFASCLSVVSLAADATLRGFASLPADSFVPGPTSGATIMAANGRKAPFVDRQPVQGVSALLAEPEGTLLALVDNGFGTQFNSVDFLLRVYRLVPEFRTVDGGSGHVSFGPVMTLHDPDNHIRHAGTWEIIGYWRDSETFPWDIRIADYPWLTGADFDPESLQRGPDGTFWIGEEFGPYLLNVDAVGRLLRPPVELDGLRSPDNHDLRGGEATLLRSRGFEGMAIAPSGEYLYPMLEGSLSGEDKVLNIYTFDLQAGAWLNADARSPSHRYRIEEMADSIGAFTLADELNGLILERDNEEGVAARHKKIYRVQLGKVDASGLLLKTEVADLLNIADPNDLDGDGSTHFSFPFQTIESLVVVDRNTLLIANDNNFPFSSARRPGSPDDTELILIEVGDLW